MEQELRTYMSENRDEFIGYVKATLKSIAGTTLEIKHQLLAMEKRNSRQDNEIERLKNNQWWFIRIFGLMQTAAVGFFAWLWGQRF